MKKLRLIFNNGAVWEVDAHEIASNCADYFAAKEGYTWVEEYKNIMSDDFELKDWLVGNMNWDELVTKVKVQEPSEPDYSVMLLEGEYESSFIS